MPSRFFKGRAGSSSDAPSEILTLDGLGSQSPSRNSTFEVAKLNVDDVDDDIDADPISLAEIGFTDIFMPLIAVGAKMSIAPRYTPEIVGPGEAKTRAFPEFVNEAIDRLREVILDQQRIRTGVYEDNGAVLPRWWKGVVEFEGMQLRYAITIASNSETWVVIRRIPLQVPTIESLGLPKEAATVLHRIGNSPSGLVLVAGSTGAGKTTTAISMLGTFLRNNKKKAYTIEDPPEYRVQGLHGEGLCIQTDIEYNGNWVNGIKTALRSFPDYIFIGEIRDSSVALAALRAAMSGHLVITTIHAGSVADALDVFLRLVSETPSEAVRQQLAQQLTAIIHQTRNNQDVSVTILDAREGEMKANLRRLLSDNKTAALGENWVKEYPNNNR